MRAAIANYIGSLNPRTRRLALFALVGLAIIAVPSLAYAADVIGWILLGLAKIFEWLTSLVGFILFHEVRGLIAVAAYSDFVAPGPTAVRVGWVVARDLANMFFILILLVIAFATILSYEEYNIRRLLPRLLIMAVVINFSKTISGIIIDFGQVVMLTFVNGFKDAAGGNFLNAFQVRELLRLKEAGKIEESGLLLGMMLAFIMVSIAAMVVLIMLVTLIFRIVMLWVLIILSPIAFLASTIPPGRQYYQMWWDEMKRYVLYGPVVAFFLWLALLSAQLSNNGNIARGDDQGGAFPLEERSAAAVETAQQGTANDIPTAASSTDVYLSMIIFASLLFAGLKVATQVGGVGGGTAKFLQGMTKKAVKGAGKFAGRQAMKPVRDVAGSTMSGVGRALSRVPLVGGAGTTLAVQGERMKAKRRAEREKIRGTAEERAVLTPAREARDLKKITPTALKAGGGGMRKRFLDRFGRVTKSKQGVEATRGGGGFQQQRRGVMETDEKLQGIIDAGGVEAEEAEAQQKSWRKKNVGFYDSDMQKEILKGMKPEDVRDAVPADQFGGLAGNMSWAQMQEYGKKGTPEQREAANAWAANADPDQMQSLMQNKKAKADELPKEWFNNAGAARYALDSTAGDAKARAELMKDDQKRQALQQAAAQKLQGTKDGGSARELSSAALESIKVGSLTADDIRGDAQLQGAIGNTMDVKSLAKGIDKSDDQQVEAAMAAMASVLAAHPEREAKYRKSDQYDDIMPNKLDVTKVTGVSEAAQPLETSQVVSERPVTVDASEIESALSSAADKLSGMPEGAGAGQLRSSMDNLSKAMDRLKQLQSRWEGASDEEALKEISSLLEEQNATVERLMNEIRKAGGGENA